jgi:ferredoxin
MCDYEGVFSGMNGVIFYSNTGQSKAIAEYFAKELAYPLLDIEKNATAEYENLVLVFPVYCQNIPDLVKTFLDKVRVGNLTLIATYGKMCPGNVLYEIQHKYPHKIVAAAYIPTKHTYVEDDEAFCDFDGLISVVEKIKNPAIVALPKLYKNPLADIFPRWRSRAGLRLRKNSHCNGCNVCAENCSFQAIHFGVTNGKCIRCLRCVKNCPKGALDVKIGLPLRLSLRF